ncbi:hypothetical protein NQ314_003505, partial [Rhamnusium bicolor]
MEVVIGDLNFNILKEEDRDKVKQQEETETYETANINYKYLYYELSQEKWDSVNEIIDPELCMNNFINIIKTHLHNSTQLRKTTKKFHIEREHIGWTEPIFHPIFNENGTKVLVRLPVKDGENGHYMHICEIYNNKVRPLTHGAFELTRILAWDEENQYIYAIGTIENAPGVRHLIRIINRNSSSDWTCMTCRPLIDINMTFSENMNETMINNSLWLDYPCDFNNVIFSKNYKYYIQECLGPEIPIVLLVKTSTNTRRVVLDTSFKLRRKVRKLAPPQIKTISVEIEFGYKAQVRLYLPGVLREYEDVTFPLILLVRPRWLGLITFTLQGVKIMSKDSLKCLGVILDKRSSQTHAQKAFTAYVEKATAKAPKTIATLESVMPNVEGPKSSKSRMLRPMTQSRILYGAPEEPLNSRNVVYYMLRAEEDINKISKMVSLILTKKKGTKDVNRKLNDAAPSSQSVSSKWELSWPWYLTSTRNYIVAKIDARGSGFQGVKMRREIQRRIGLIEVQDQLAVLTYLRDTFKFIDRSKICTAGKGYGGFVSAMMLLQDFHQVINCSVSISPITNWRYFNSYFAEKYLGFPSRHLQEYDNADLTMKAANLNERNLLLIHGTADTQVTSQHSLMLAKALIVQDILFQQLV